MYWKFASKHETEKEKLLLCYQVNEQIQQGKFPVTKELALELCTLLAQVFILCFFLFFYIIDVGECATCAG